VPTWAVLLAPAFMARAMKGEHKRKGSTGNPIARARSLDIEYKHWNAVRTVLDFQKDPDWHAYKALLKSPNLTSVERKRLLANGPRDPGHTLEDAFEVASEYLKGTPAFRSPATIRRSYFRVEKASRCPSAAPRYLLLSLETRRHFFGEAYLMPEERPVKCQDLRRTRH
jgi:hypothetical protein